MILEAILLALWTSLIASVFYRVGEHHGIRDAARNIAARNMEAERWETFGQG